MKNFKYLVFAFLAIFSMGKINAASVDGRNHGILEGWVIDNTSHQPLNGAVVEIIDLKMTSVTDSSGHFIFKGLPVGHFMVESRFVGYRSMVLKATVVGTTVHPLNFSLQPTAAEISEVVVTGTMHAMQIKRTPISIVTVDHQFLFNNISSNAIDAIAKIPGVRAVTTGPNVSKPFIRGLGYNRILTLFDGIRQEGQQWGDEHGIEVDPYSVYRVEVLRGPASLTYGSDAMGGVVNMIPFPAAPEGKKVGELVVEYQSNNRMPGLSLMLGATKNGFEWMGRVSHRQAIDYTNKIDGRVFGTAFKETDLNGGIGLHRSWGYSHLNVSYFDDLQEIPDGSRDSVTGRFTRQITDAGATEIVSEHDLTSYKIEKVHQHVRHIRAYMNNNFILGAGSLDLNLAFQRSWRQEFSNPDYPSVPGLDLRLNTYTYDLKYHFPEFKEWNLTAGFNGMYQDNKVQGTDFIIPSYTQNDIGPFFAAHKKLGNFDLTGGLRMDVRNFHEQELYTTTDASTGLDKVVTGADTLGASKIFSRYSHTFTGWSSSLGLTYQFNDNLSVKANVAKGFRAPNISELSANGVHPGTNYYQIGNPDFKPESNYEADLGLIFTSSPVVIQFSVFENNINNYIYDRKLLSVNGGDSVTVSGTPQTYKFESTRAQLYGGEFSLDLHLLSHLHFENNISAVWALNRGQKGESVPDSLKYLPNISPLHGLTELRYEFASKALSLNHAFVLLQMEYYATQNRYFSAYGTETRTPGYTLFNAGLGGSILKKNGKVLCSVSFEAQNIFNIAYQDHLSRLKYFDYAGNHTGHSGIYNMGRNLGLKVNFPLF